MPIALLFLWLAYVAAIAYRFADFPGLHGDEAFVGLSALRALELGHIASPHGITNYSGGLHAAVVSWVFALAGPSTGALRAAGLLCNAAGVALAACAIRCASGLPGAAVFLASANASLALLLFPRLAWEVAAFQVLLAALCLGASVRILTHEGSLLGWSFAYCLAVSLGTASHFIFISLPLSLLAAAAWLAALSPRRAFLRLFALQAAGLGLAAMTYLIKPQIDEQDYLRFRHLWNLSIWLLLPAAGAACVACISQGGRWMARARCARARVFKAEAGRSWSLPGALLGGLAAGVLATANLLFFQNHGAVLLGTVAGHLPVARMGHQAPAFWALIAQYVLAGAWLLCAFVGFAWAVLPNRLFPRIRLLPAERLLLLAPLSYFSVFPLFTEQTAPRYYILANLLLAASFGVLSGRWLCAPQTGIRALGRGAVAALAAGLVAAQATHWSLAGSDELRPPIRIEYAGYQDTSEHFLKLEELEERLREDGACEIRASGFFIEFPLAFLRRVRPYPCRPGIWAEVHYCRDCLEPPRYFSVRVHASP